MASSTAEQFLSAKPAVNYANEEKNFTIWDANRETLKRLFLTENCTLEMVKRRMETEHDFPNFALSDYETTLRDRYGFRKNLKASDWHSIGYHVEKRRLQGKPSHIYLGGILQKPRKVEKEIRRYNRRSVLQDRIRRHCVLPPLIRHNISIRTPSPELRRNRDTMINIFSAVKIAIPSECIDSIRLQSPFTKFVSTFMGQTMSNTTTAITTETNRRLPVSTIEMSPSLMEASDLALLSQACYILSNRLDSSFTRSLLKWVGISAEFNVLKRFFSIQSFTIQAVWEDLYQLSVILRQVRAYNILVELDLSINKGQWVTRRPTCLIDAIAMKSIDKLKVLLKKPNINPNSTITWGELRGVGIGLNRTPPLPRDPHVMLNPLAIAALRCDLDIIEILLKHGARVNPPPVGEVVLPLFAALHVELGAAKPSFAIIMGCICALLDAGSNVDVYPRDSRMREPTSRWGWSAPGSPLWLIDYTWTYFPSLASLLTKFSEKSLKMQSEVTVAGVCLAANEGYENLQQYLASRQLPNGEDRTAVLQIAISEAAARGLSGPVSCLLQLGVDPNVKYIEDDDGPCSNRGNSQSWHPAVRAAHGQHYHILKILKDRNAYSQPLLIIRKLLNGRDGAELMTYHLSVVASFSSMIAALSLVELFCPEIKMDGRSLMLLFLERAYQKNFPVCATVCDMAWSWGVPLIIGDDGRDALHYAIFHNCCLDMVMFLVARGYCVHSKLAYDYDHLFLSSSLSITQTRRLHPPSRSTMLGDAFASQSDDRVAIVNFLLEQGSKTETVRKHHTLLESVFSPPMPPAPHLSVLDAPVPIFDKWNGIFKYKKDTIAIFEKFFCADIPVNGPPQRVPPLSVLTSLIRNHADDALIFQVIDVTRNIDEYIAGSTPLLGALLFDRLAVAKRLLDRGAKVNHPAYAGDVTPLVAACRSKNIPIEFVEDMIKLGANINPPCGDNMPPLHTAVSVGKLNVTALLLKHGADLNWACHWIMNTYATPLDVAAIGGRLDIIHLLRSLGGESWVPGTTGVDGAIVHARKWGHHAVAEFLCSSSQ
ncbi:hypothetical protein F4803DRAFT_528911 [Xylaria telfairii]|nr:hypothetical protein F4803DRAFT_528911 [Xylaria telfairii]